jgi:xylulokinase
MPTVIGVDLSTQSTKVIACDADNGAILRQGRAPHPDGTEVHPDAWWAAFMQASSGVIDRAAAISVAGQQHGMVALDDDGRVVRPAILWNDTRSASAAEDLIREAGGADAWAQAVGLVPVASFTVTKLRWLAQHERDAAARVASVVLPHDWLTWRLRGRESDLVTDRGDASGTGYWSPAVGRYRTDLLVQAFGREIAVPRVAGPSEALGQAPGGLTVGPGTGDNMAAALGLGAGPGDVVVSLGTSGAAFAVAEAPTADAAGIVAGFADATGRFLPLVCTLNAARVLSATAQMLGTDLATLDRLALASAPGADGITLLPYLEGERTPNLPTATGTLVGLTRAAMTPKNIARAAVEGMLCGLADGLDALRAAGVTVRRVLLIGGAARSRAVRAIAPDILGLSVTVPAQAEYVALGAARQAAWVLSGSKGPPAWPVAIEEVREPASQEAGREVQRRYAEARRHLYGL